jgi:hypothetical protein
VWPNLLLKSDGLCHCCETHAPSHFNQSLVEHLCNTILIKWTTIQLCELLMNVPCLVMASKIFLNQFMTIVIIDEEDFLILPIVHFDLKLFENY